MAMDSKKLGAVIAIGMPPPDKLKKAMAHSDEGESEQDAQSESDSGEMGGGKGAFMTMMKAMKNDDMDGAWDAFCDAVDIAKNRNNDSNSSGDRGFPDKSSYG
jgi:hypothetical protein